MFTTLTTIASSFVLLAALVGGDNSVGLPSCCIEQADCCAAGRDCCPQSAAIGLEKTPVDATVGDEAATQAGPICCLKRAYCCSIQASCCKNAAQPGAKAADAPACCVEKEACCAEELPCCAALATASTK